MYDIYDNDFDRAFDEAVDEIEKRQQAKGPFLCDPDKNTLCRKTGCGRIMSPSEFAEAETSEKHEAGDTDQWQ